MKTNQKKLKLIKYGLKPSTVSGLSESQVNQLYNRLLSEQTQLGVTNVSSKNPKASEIAKNLNAKGVNVNMTETEVSEDDTEVNVTNASKGMYTQDKIQKPSPDGTDDEKEIEDEYKRLVEKFESKKQQKYFFAKCGDGKTKEQKRWCKMAEEFASKTKNFKKLPEKKKEETNESGMSNYYKKVGSAFAGGLKSKLKDTLNPTFGESELEKQVLRLVEKHITPKMTKKEFLNLVREERFSTAPARPEVKPDVDTPTRPKIPATPYKPKPGVKPKPKAGRESLPKWLSFDEIGINLK
jgi:hypothetical protein